MENTKENNETVIMQNAEETKESQAMQSLEKESVLQRAEVLIRLVERIRAETKLLPASIAKRTRERAERIEKEEAAKKARLNVTINEKTLFNDRPAFMKRLKSFSVRFINKERPLTALDCAKYGWKDTNCVDNTNQTTCILSCDNCKSKMYVVEVNQKYKYKPRVIQAYKKYEQGLSEYHKEDCPWRNSHCDDKIYHFPYLFLKEGLEQFKGEARSILSACKAKGETIPTLKYPLDDKMLTKVKYLASLYEKENCSEIEKDSKEMIDSAYLLTVFGWSSLHEGIPGIQCNLCFKRKAFNCMDSDFDVFNQHRPYCPWINVTIANAFSPNLTSNTQNIKINGIDWMKDVIYIEYFIQIRREDLSLFSRNSQSKKFEQVRQKIRKSHELVDSWMMDLDKITKPENA
ncbi:C3HC zinc finger-like-domain-containing protein [Cokeromyces recurvatus]|uniref:C3HC zinc finger-like-domain-containing protein n=1 Tax=Cokeromyces recurvatus TaxID=90255 RepID=UPI00221F1AC6|nr:C3HC zinc finger-like-domain-containing protein [Cokeromyces recurvatus]KAI7901976.1 C3HC zinc finger-like-domain-containing protein [Cokeromyces recurvatus]